MGIGANVQKIAQKENISLKELSRRAGIPYTTVYNMVKRDSDRISPENVQKLADALKVGIGELYGLKIIDGLEKCGLPLERSNIHDIGQMLTDDAQNQKDELDLAFNELNSKGRSEAIKRVKELKQIPEYSLNIQDEAERVAKILAQVVTETTPKPEKEGELWLTEEQLTFLFEKILLGEVSLPKSKQQYAQECPPDAPEDTDPKKD